MSAPTSFCSKVADALTSVKKDIIHRHNEWNDWVVSCFKKDETQESEIVEMPSLKPSFLHVSKDSTWWGTALKVAALFLLSHVIGPLGSAIKSCYSWAQEKCVENCCCCQEVDEGEPEEPQEKVDGVAKRALPDNPTPDVGTN